MYHRYIQLFLFFALKVYSVFTDDNNSVDYESVEILKQVTEATDNHLPIWAILVAGSNEWDNYRHQADLCRAYHLLKDHGVRPENIITMMFDDIANNTNNPYPGKIFNEPNGPDVYAGVPIDYKGKDVNPANFLAIITGNKSAVSGGNGRVLESNATENVFINFVDHGSTGLIAFPHGVITAKDLNNALKEMFDNQMYRNLVFYMEACESGSMFENILQNDTNVYVVTAANASESSYAYYCDNNMDLPCLGDLFSVMWMEDTETENINTESLYQQFKIVKKETNLSHVMHYGDQKISQEPVGEYQGWMNPHQLRKKKEKSLDSAIDTRDLPLYEIRRQIKRSRLKESRKSLKDQLLTMQKKRLYLNQFMNDFILTLDSSSADRLLKKNSFPIIDFDCHDTVVKAFHEYCFNFGANTYALNFGHIFKNICNEKMDIKKILRHIIKKCRGNMISGIR